MYMYYVCGKVCYKERLVLFETCEIKWYITSIMVTCIFNSHLISTFSTTQPVIFIQNINFKRKKLG